MKTVQMDDETHARLKVFADGRPLGKTVKRLLDVVERLIEGEAEAVERGEVVDPPGPHGGTVMGKFSRYPFPEDKKVKK